MIPFRIGDRVKTLRGIAGVKKGLIIEVTICQGEFEYGISGTWWHSHNNLTLVAEATEESVAEVLAMVASPEDEDYEDYEEI